MLRVIRRRRRVVWATWHSVSAHPQSGGAPQLPASKQHPQELWPDPVLAPHHLLQLGHAGLLLQLHGHSGALVVAHKHCEKDRGCQVTVMTSLVRFVITADVYRSARTGTASVRQRRTPDLRPAEHLLRVGREGRGPARWTRQNSPIIPLFVLQAADLFTPRCILGSVILIFPLLQ